MKIWNKKIIITHETCFLQIDDNANIFKILVTIAIFHLMYSKAKHQNKFEEYKFVKAKYR